MEVQNISIKHQTRQLLEQLPPEGLQELASFIEFLQFKYRRPVSPEQAASAPIDQQHVVPPDSLTARYRGFVESTLSVAELTTAYELTMMDDNEDT